MTDRTRGAAVITWVFVLSALNLWAIEHGLFAYGVGSFNSFALGVFFFLNWPLPRKQ